MASQTIKGITIKLGADASELSTALNDANKSITQARKSLREVEKALKFNPGNSDLVKQKAHLLNEEVKGTRTSLENMNKALKEMDARGIDKTDKEYMDLQRDIIITEGKLQKLTNQQKRFVIEGSKIGQVADKMKRVGNTASEAANKIRGVSMGATVGLGAAVAVTSEFDSSMSQVLAVSGATQEEFQQLRDKAREMGETTKFSASESADAFNYMAMAGWKTDDMLQGISGILSLAAASGTDLATTSDIVTDALTAMGYAAGDAGQLADVMAAASSNANTNVEMMGETFKYVGTVAGAMGYSMEDVALATGMMANSGIKAEQAGTSLRSIMTRMAAPTGAVKKAMEELGIEINNADGTAKPFREVIGQLREAMSGMSETEKTGVASTIAGKNAMSGFLALVNGSDADFEKLASAIDSSNGSAEEMATVMQDNLGGQVTILKSALQELAISVGDTLVPIVKKAVGVVQAIVDKFNSLSESQKRTISTVVLLTAALAPALAAFGAIAGGISLAVGAFATLFVRVGSIINVMVRLGTVVLPMVKTAVKALFTALRANPIGAVITVVTLLIGAFVTAYKKSETFRNAVNKLASRLKAFLGDVRRVASGIISTLSNAFGKLSNIGMNIVRGIWSGISGGLGWIKSKISGWVGNVKTFLKNLFGIHSPSTWARDMIGGNIVAGMAQGITGNAKMVNRAMTSLVGAATPRMMAGSQSIVNSRGAGNMYSFGNISLDVSKLSDATTIEQVADIFMKAKAFV